MPFNLIAGRFRNTPYDDVVVMGQNAGSTDKRERDGLGWVHARRPLADHREETTMENGSTPVLDALVDFVLDLEPAGLPPAVTEAAGRCLTDWLGTAIRGAREPLADALAAVIAVSGGEAQATAVGRGGRTSALHACLANGAQAHALDFDDTHLPSIVHGSAPVAPVVLALGEWRRLGGAAALGAFVAGFEVETRIGRVLGRALADRGWHVTGILGHFGAAAAAGKLLGLSREQFRCALGIAGTQAAGLELSFGTMSKPLHPGKAAMNGLLAALLAREGFTGPVGVLDAPGGLAGTFLGAVPSVRAVEDLGKRFEILDNSTKPYAACHLTHATIDAARRIRDRWGPAADAIAGVECWMHPLALKVAAQPAPRTGLEAKFSSAFCAAVGLLRGDAGEAEFADAAVGDPVVSGVAARVQLHADPALPIWAARMRVRLGDGRALEEEVQAARGTPGNPLSLAEVEAKFHRLAGVVLPADRVQHLATVLRDLAAVPDMSAVAVLTVP
jgi:2-methylcitrate dehydratase PrpD